MNNPVSNPVGELVQVVAELPEHEAWAVALLLKRMSWQACREHAVSDTEAYDMQHGIDRLREALREAGFGPR